MLINHIHECNSGWKSWVRFRTTQHNTTYLLNIIYIHIIKNNMRYSKMLPWRMCLGTETEIFNWNWVYQSFTLCTDFFSSLVGIPLIYLTLTMRLNECFLDHKWEIKLVSFSILTQLVSEWCLKWWQRKALPLNRKWYSHFLSALTAPFKCRYWNSFVINETSYIRTSAHTDANIYNFTRTFSVVKAEFCFNVVRYDNTIDDTLTYYSFQKFPSPATMFQLNWVSQAICLVICHLRGFISSRCL